MKHLDSIKGMRFQHNCVRYSRFGIWSDEPDETGVITVEVRASAKDLHSGKVEQKVLATMTGRIVNRDEMRTEAAAMLDEAVDNMGVVLDVDYRNDAAFVVECVEVEEFACWRGIAAALYQTVLLKLEETELLMMPNEAIQENKTCWAAWRIWNNLWRTYYHVRWATAGVPSVVMGMLTYEDVTQGVVDTVCGMCSDWDDDDDGEWCDEEWDDWD